MFFLISYYFFVSFLGVKASFSEPIEHHLIEFSKPINSEILLSGTFGELRANHFHAGIDVKTKSQEGKKIFSVETGYIAKIKVSPYNFGKVIYVNHYNGLTSVYAHLQKFSDSLENIVKAEQYKKKSYSVVLNFKPNQIKINKNQHLAYSGNTGRSRSPHLHFELRKTSSQTPINPLKYFKSFVKDTISPVVKKLYGVCFSSNSQINGISTPIQINLIPQKDGTLLADRIYADGVIGFEILTFDRQTYTRNKNGIYQLEVLINGSKEFGYKMDEFEFKNTNQINTLIDYSLLYDTNETFQKAYKYPKNDLSIYTTRNSGKIKIENGFTYVVDIIIKDYHTNKTKIRIPIKGKKKPILSRKQTKPDTKYVLKSRDHLFMLNNFSFYFPPDLFYENVSIDFKEKGNVIYLHKNNIPLKRKFKLSFETKDYPKHIHSKLYFSFMGKTKEKPIFKSYLKADKIEIYTNKLGVYSVKIDTIPPRIIPLNISNFKDMKYEKKLRIKAVDTQTSIHKYEACINDSWVLMEYDPKTNTFSYDFKDIKLNGIKHNFLFKAVDRLGNYSTIKLTFFKNN